MENKAKPKHIPGIYNYCDRWCERCTFTSRCAVYANTSNLSPEQNDINNKVFWDNFSKNFADAITMLHEAAQKHGIEIKPITGEELDAFNASIKASITKLEEHPLIKTSKNYYQQAKQLLENNTLMRYDGNALVQLVELGIKNVGEAKNELAEITDCLEVVQWYLFQINVKFMRAMPIKRSELKDATFKSDSNGSAKVALIAVDRCILAWQKLMRHLPQAADEIIGLLAMLQKIQTVGEKTFPEARAFKRIGFDD